MPVAAAPASAGETCCFRLHCVTSGTPAAAALSYFLSVCRDGSEHILIGLFATPEQAAQEYDQAALDMHGTEAFTNFASESCIALGLTGHPNMHGTWRPSPTVSLSAASGQCTRCCIQLNINDVCVSARCTA